MYQKNPAKVELLDGLLIRTKTFVKTLFYNDILLNISIEGVDILENYSAPILYLGSHETKEIIFTWNTIGKPSGNYTVTARIFIKSIIINQNVSSFEIQRYLPMISTGWHLITVPTENNYWASSIAENISGCQMVSRFDGVNQTYKTYIVGSPPSFDFPIVDGCGYFVLVNQSSTLSLSGYLIESVSVPLGVGWNMIGWYHASETLASSLGGNISGCQMVSRFDSVNQTFKTYIVGGPPSFDFSITPGMGLFILVNIASTWNGEG